MKNNSVPKTFLGIPAKRIFWLFVYSLVLCLVVGFVVWFFTNKVPDVSNSSRTLPTDNFTSVSFEKDGTKGFSQTSKVIIAGGKGAVYISHPGYMVVSYPETGLGVSSLNLADDKGGIFQVNLTTFLEGNFPSNIFDSYNDTVVISGKNFYTDFAQFPKNSWYQCGPHERCDKVVYTEAYNLCSTGVYCVIEVSGPSGSAGNKEYKEFLQNTTITVY